MILSGILGPSFPNSRGAVPYTQETENCFAAAIGDRGREEAPYRALLDDCAKPLSRLREAHANGSMALLGQPQLTEDLEVLEPIAERYRERFADVVVFGTGGSSLGGRTLSALGGQNLGMDAGAAPDSPRLHFMDNPDPDSFDRLFRAIDPTLTGIIAISKSGSTPETLAQFLYCFGVFCQAMGDGTQADQFTVITEPADNPLRRMALGQGLTLVDADPLIDGRFSALSAAGLLPAMIAGVDAGAVREGAAAVLAPLLDGAGASAFDPAIGAAINVGLARHRGIKATVLMPYLDRLSDFTLWFRQLWAESLGKGGQGTTPIGGLGPADQHSQLQLYLDGPGDKMFTLIMAPEAGGGGIIPAGLAEDPDLTYLAGKSLGDLVDAEQRATAESLAGGGHPTRLIRLRQVDEAGLGALIMHFFLETIIAADLMGVDPFGQPAVEEGKQLARQYLREGDGQ